LTGDLQILGAADQGVTSGVTFDGSWEKISFEGDIMPEDAKIFILNN